MNWKELPEYYKKIKIGSKKIAKSILNVDIANNEIIEARRKICINCEFRIKGNNENSLGKCGICGCFIYHKTRLLEEKCPKNYW